MANRETLSEWAVGVYRRHGRLTPQIVLEEARPPESPAHEFVFDKPIAEAAEAYYLGQAHRLIQVVRVRVVREDAESPRLVRAFHYVQDDRHVPVYEYVERLIERPDLFQQAKDKAIARVHQAEEAVEDLDALAVGKLARQASGVALVHLRRASESLATMQPQTD